MKTHPTPWRWDHKPSGHIPWCLVDADGMSMGVVGTMPDADAIPPAVREVIRLAPELEAALRKVQWRAENGGCPECMGTLDDDAVEKLGGYGKGIDLTSAKRHHDGCDLARILAALDAARKATP